MGIKSEMSFDVDEITANTKDIVEKKIQDKRNHSAEKFIAQGMDPEQATEAAIARYESENRCGDSDSVKIEIIYSYSHTIQGWTHENHPSIHHGRY